MTKLLNHPQVEPLLSDEHFSVDGTLIEAIPRAGFIARLPAERAVLDGTRDDGEQERIAGCRDGDAGQRQVFREKSVRAFREHDTSLFVALELSRSTWLVAASAPGSKKVSKLPHRCR